jgi:hypothetical protein
MNCVGDAVAVLGVHVRLDLEHEAGEVRVQRLHPAGGGLARGGLGRQLQELHQERLHAEVGERAAEVGGAHLARQERLLREPGPRLLQQRQVVEQLLQRVLGNDVVDAVVVERNGVLFGAALAVVFAALEQVDALVAAVVHAQEAVAGVDRPGHGVALHPQLALHVVEELDGVGAGAVALVDEGDHRRAPHPAHLEQLARLLLHALAVVEQHHRAVGRHQGAVGVFGEVLVARGVEQVHRVAAVLELQHRAGHADAALLLHRHPVAGGVPRRTACLHAPGQVDGSAVQEELFRERGLPRVGVADNGEGPPSADLGSKLIHVGPGQTLPPRPREVRATGPVCAWNLTPCAPGLNASYRRWRKRGACASATFCSASVIVSRCPTNGCA